MIQKLISVWAYYTDIFTDGSFLLIFMIMDKAENKVF